MESGGFVLALFGFPLIVGLLIGALFAVPVILVAVQLGLMRLVGATIDALRGRWRRSRVKHPQD